MSDYHNILEKKRREERRSYVLIRSVRDITMSVLILSMAILMLFGTKIPFTKKLVFSIDPLMRYMFGGLCLIYGSFRLYRAIKKDY
jgi:uncharacterized membrane protein YedE/YeeE